MLYKMLYIDRLVFHHFTAKDLEFELEVCGKFTNVKFQCSFFRVVYNNKYKASDERQEKK